MRIAVIGAGGVGGYFGARLAASGNDVLFVQRGAHLAAMRENGLTVTSKLGDVTLPEVSATDDPRGESPAEVVLITVKSNETERAAALAGPLIGPETMVISLQNGVENEDRLVAALGTGSVAGGVTHILSLIEAPGVISHKGPFARIIFGELDGSMSPRVEAFAGVCGDADIEAKATDKIDSYLWSKFCMLCPHSGMTALLRSAIGPIRDDPEGRETLLRAAGEVIALAQARGVSLPEKIVHEPMSQFEALPPEMTSSLHYDLTHGKPLELEWLNGAVVRLAREAGLEAPVNQVIYAALRPFADGSSAQK